MDPGAVEQRREAGLHRFRGLTSLQELEAAGVQVLVCGTCLNHFKLLEQKQVGETTNMLDIVTHMQLADKVVSVT